MKSHSQTIVYLSSIQLDRDSAIPLYRQIYDALREAILSGKLPASAQLPASRELAVALNVSRTTVLNAIDQLIAEGYLETHIGSGTYVASNLPEDLLHAMSLPDSQRVLSSNRELGRIGKIYQSYAARNNLTDPSRNPYRMFQIDNIDRNDFPSQIWSRLVEKYTRHPKRLPNGGSVSGYYPLREAITQYLITARGVHCTSEQVIVVTSSQQALYIVAQLVLENNASFWMEDPGYPGARYTLITSGGNWIPVPVDEHGIDVEAGIELAPDARLAYVTPARQYPLGYTMSLERRIKLLSWAENNGAWIVEDDYDSEYRYDSYPLSALQGLDTNQRVIYIGTFSKVMMSDLRIAYVVLPPDMIGAFKLLRGLIDRFNAVPFQAALADFINEGHFARHIRRTRKIYQQKRDVIVAELKKQVGDAVEIGAHDSGMHIVVYLPDGISDSEAHAAMAAHQLNVGTLSSTYLNDPSRQGLILGYTAVPIDKIPLGIQWFAQALETVLMR